jgi:hypothetical protein
MDPNRPANALLMTQVKHMQDAERQLPPRYRSEIYIHAIHTEQEAAEYIREVTEAIHKAHADAEKKRRQRQKQQKRLSVVELAASAERASPKRSKKKAAKKKQRRK